MKKQLKVLVAQYKPITGETDSNISKFERIIKKYNYFKPDLVIFPEYALTGIGPGPNFYINKNQLEQVSKLAKKHNTYLVPGSFIREVNSKKYNQTCLIGNKGKILGFYSKQCLWVGENRILSKGKSSKIFKTKFGKVALTICADLHSPLISSNLMRQKPDLIINVSLWSQEDREKCHKLTPYNIEANHATKLSQARALENQCHFIYCNYADNTTYTYKSGKEINLKSIGNSMVINPYGETTSKVDSEKEQVLLSQLNLKQSHWSKLGYY